MSRTRIAGRATPHVFEILMTFATSLLFVDDRNTDGKRDDGKTDEIGLNSIMILSLKIDPEALKSMKETLAD